jgi:hypothetical protein
MVHQLLKRSPPVEGGREFDESPDHGIAVLESNPGMFRDFVSALGGRTVLLRPAQGIPSHCFYVPSTFREAMSAIRAGLRRRTTLSVFGNSRQCGRPAKAAR